MRVFVALISALLLSTLAGSLSAAVVGKGVSPAGTLFARPVGDDYYRVLPANADINASDTIATAPGAALTAVNGSVTLRCVGDYDDRAEVPILESAFTLNDAKEGDFDLTLDRGRVELTNSKASGKATVLVRFAGETWSIVLETPGTKVVVELCGRWAAGTRFQPMKTQPPASPVLLATLIVIQGTADVKVGGQTISLTAKQRIQWDSLAGPRSPETLAKLPGWASEVKPNLATMEAFREIRASNPGEAITKFLASEDPVRRRIAIVALGANDDVARLVQFLGEARTREEWDFGTSVLRHWLGRGPGQDRKLYERLQADAGLTESQARIVLQLLFGFHAADLRQPETFEVLIDYLLHEKPAIRGLAAWHLARLVPKEKAVPFVLNASPAECETMHQEWKKVIPSGERPPR